MPGRRLHRRRLYFRPLKDTEHGSPPPLTTRDRELVSLLKMSTDLRATVRTVFIYTFVLVVKCLFRFIFLNFGHNKYLCFNTQF